MSENSTNARPDASLLRFRLLALTTVLTTYALVVLGGVVRATESGDACPDWPRCKGELIPPFESAILIEFSHRLLASVVGLLVVALVIYAWRTQRHRTVVVRGAAVAIVLLVGQVLLGGATVLSDLPANMVTAHLALASILLATLIVVAIASLDIQPADSPEHRASALSFRNAAFAGALAIFALMLTGSYVSGSGASLAFDDWPLFNGQLFPEGSRLPMIHALHRFSAVIVGLFLVHIAVKGLRRARWHGGFVFGIAAALVLYIAQVFAGAANIWTQLQPSAAVTHLALAVAVWALLIGVTVFAHRAARRLPERGRDHAGERDQESTRREGAASGSVSAGSTS